MSVPNYVKPAGYRQQPGKSRRRFWMIFGIVASLIVLVSLAFSLLVVTGVFVGLNTFFNTTSEPTPVTANYYLAIMSHDYAKAYTDLDRHATINGQQVDQQTFITLATTVDTQNGNVSGYSIEGTDPSRPTITVHRGARIYQVHLQLQQENGVWKIISADDI
jgi:hypothetical protein